MTVVEGNFDFSFSAEERHLLKVMVMFLIIGIAIIAICSLDPVKGSFGLWRVFQEYSFGIILTSVVAIAFLWFVNTAKIMVEITSLAMFIAIIVGFGIIIVSIPLYLLFPDFFSLSAFVFGLGICTTVLGMGL